jgi:integrase
MAQIKLRYVNGFPNRDRKSKRVRYYFRRRGTKAIPLPGLPGSEEFMAAYAAALASIPDQQLEVAANRTLPGTINALVVTYYRSDEWHALAADTQKTRRRIIERFRAQHGDKRVALLQREHILKMLAAIGKPSAKRHWLKAIRGLMRVAVPNMRKDDPTEGIPGVKLPKTKGHHTWTDQEIERYRAYWALGSQQRLVMEFALETASRRGEVIRLGPQHVKDGRIHIERTHGSDDVDLIMSPQLQAACSAMPTVHLTYIVRANGKPRSKYGLGNDFAKWATEAGLPVNCRLHGLKKGGMRRLAEAGGTAHELMAISGHKTLTEVQRYTKDADRKKLADSAMAKLRGRSENTNVTNIDSPLHKQGANPLKTKGRSNELAVPTEVQSLSIVKRWDTSDLASFPIGY